MTAEAAYFSICRLNGWGGVQDILSYGDLMKNIVKTGNKGAPLARLAGILALAAISLLAFAACDDGSSGSDPWSLEEHILKYMEPHHEKWEDGALPVDVYFLDVDSFETIKAELAAAGEYSGFESNSQSNRDWDRDMTFLRCVLRSDGRLEMALCKADNSLEGYDGKEVSSGAKPKTEAVLHKYMAPKQEKWPEYNGKITYVYNLDVDRFDEFKAELDASGTYLEAEGNARTRTDDGRDNDDTGARWCALPSGLIFKLEIWNKATKYEADYRYIKN